MKPFRTRVTPGLAGTLLALEIVESLKPRKQKSSIKSFSARFARECLDNLIESGGIGALSTKADVEDIDVVLGKCEKRSSLAHHTSLHHGYVWSI